MVHMSTQKPGKPAKSAADLAARVPGMPRFSVEVPAPLLKRVDTAAKRNDRSRNAEVRVLLAEALDARKRAEEEKSEVPS